MQNTTATGDIIMGPGCPKRLFKGMPVSLVGDAVTGAACVGTVTTSTVVKVLVQGRPPVNLGSTVVGTNPATGVPVTTAVAVCTNMTTII
ncbi:MAG: hypothetical protein Q4F91_10315 [Sutterella sp.]|nr:hypothetical protein [Sutterella sp.]